MSSKGKSIFRRHWKMIEGKRKGREKILKDFNEKLQKNVEKRGIILYILQTH